MYGGSARVFYFLFGSIGNKLSFNFCSRSTRIREENFPGSSLLEAKSAVSNLGVERDTTLNSSEDLQAFLLHPTCWFWPALWGKTNSYRGSHPENRCCVALCSHRAEETCSPFLGPTSLCWQPHLGVLSKNRAQFWQRDALLEKHYTRALSTVSAWGEMRRTFPPGSNSTNKFWFHEISFSARCSFCCDMLVQKIGTHREMGGSAPQRQMKGSLDLK